MPGRQSGSHQPRYPRAQAGAKRGRRGAGETLAALDLGTNNCRLLIARPTSDGFHVIAGFSRIVRLGEGVGESRRLSEDAMARAVEALEVCADKVRRLRVTRARYVATEAARSAGNSSEFVDRVRRDTGIELEVLSSREEAELTMNGCRPLLDPAIRHALVFDVGGGSAELIWLRLDEDGGQEILGWTSLPCGVVSITERHGSLEFSPEAYAALIAEIEELLRPFEESYGIRAAFEAGNAQMLGTAGTVTTIAGVNMGLKRYNRALVDGSYLEFDVVHAIAGKLAASTYDERAAHPSIGYNRADLVVAGCAVLEAVCRTWPAGGMRVADRGVREGILFGMVGSNGRSRADAAE